MAGLYCQLERYEDATKQLQEALRLNPHDARAYIETGNVSIWKGDIADAIAHCRQAIIVEPKNPEAHRALAIALMRAEKYEEAEATIRKALPILTPAQPWRLYLLLSQILVQRGDITNKDRKQKELDLYEEALRYVNDAKQGNSSNAEVFFHAGIAYYKLEDYGLSQKSFADSWKLNRDRYEAERYSRIVQTVLNQQKQLFKINTLFGYVLAGACIVILAALWFPFLINTYFLKPDFPISSTVITTLTPLLLGLLVVAAMLPGLNKLKLPGGFEAEISEPKSANSNISTGPRGDIGFGSSLPLVDPEPR